MTVCFLMEIADMEDREALGTTAAKIDRGSRLDKYSFREDDAASDSPTHFSSRR
jgi:hypothetical protein